MNKITAGILGLATAAALALGIGAQAAPVRAAEGDAAAETDNVLQSGSFLSDGWTYSGDYERDYGDGAFIDSVFFTADQVHTAESGAASLVQTSSALFYTSGLSDAYTVSFGIRVMQGSVNVLFGADDTNSVSPAGAQTLTLGATSYTFGAGSAVDYGFDITNARADVTVAVGDASSTITVTSGGQTKSETLSLTAADAAGYFGFSFLEDTKAKGNLLDVTISDAEGLVYADTFTSEVSVAKGATAANAANASVSGYAWKPVMAEDVGDGGARVLRVVTGNEMHNYGTTWPSELAYTAYELVGGVGAEYTIEYDLTALRSGWFGLKLNPNKVEAGEKKINTNTIATGSECFPAFSDGKIALITYGQGDGSTLDTTETVSYEYGRKMHVSMHLQQEGDYSTKVELSFVYANDPAATVHSATFTMRSPIGGYVGFCNSLEFIFSDLVIKDKDGFVVGGDDFSTENTYENLVKNWYIGHTEAQYQYVNVEDFGTYASGSAKFDEKAGASVETTIDSRYFVPEQVGTTERPEMFSASFNVNAAALGDGSYTFLFGNKANSVTVTKDAVTAYQGGSQVGTAAFEGEGGAYALQFAAASDGTLTVQSGETVIFTAKYDGGTAFVGTYGFKVTRPTSGTMDLSLVDFEMLVEVPTAPTLEINKPAYLAVGQAVDLTPSVMSDEIDSADELDLEITVVDAEDNEITVTDDYKVTLPATGYYTVSYKLTNSFGLFVEDSFTARGIYRGSAENLADKVSADFTATPADFTIASGNVANGALTLSEGGSLQTKNNFIYFLADFEVQGAFEFVFGECHDYANAFSIKVNADNTVTLSNLYASGSLRTATLGRDLKLDEGTASVRVKVMGSTVTVYGRAFDDPMQYYELAQFTFESDMPATYGTISLRAQSGSMTVEQINIYSLDSSIVIPPDDYDPADEPPGKHKKPVLGENDNLGLIIGLSVGIPVVVIAAAVVVIVLVLKKKKNQKGSDPADSDSGADDSTKGDKEE